jgi:hypothetical protein
MAGSLIGGKYEIVVGATMCRDWSEWFEGFEMKAEGENTRLHGTVVDQAALHGLLAQLRDLGIPIFDVHRMPDSAPEGSE